jgi:hypothetical protein
MLLLQQEMVPQKSLRNKNINALFALTSEKSEVFLWSIDVVDNFLFYKNK